MGAFDTLSSRDPEATADLAAAALEQDPDDWHLAHAAAHLAAEHPQIAAAGTWPDDNPYAAHDNDHRDWIYGHTHDRTGAGREAADAAFTALNPDFGVLPDGRDPQQHRFAGDREQALALGTRAVEGLRRDNHPDPQRRQRAVARAAVEAKLRAAGSDHPTRDEARWVAELTGARPVPQRPAPERTRGDPARSGAER
jgi:hypothetical protein